MRFKTLIAAPAAIAATFVLPAIAPESIGFTTAAHADTNVSFSINTFYDDLTPYGSWTNYSNAYVFVPNVGADWRPYSVGHWEYTDRYGWLWVSEEPFGWATAHYGRWGRSDDIGWYWVPGRRWAPAWVSWKRSDDYVAWAPLPPDNDVGVSVSINVGNIPDPYWNVVPARGFLARNLARVMIRDDRERFRIVERARPIGHVTIQNNIVVNNVIDVRYVERQTRRNVRPIRVRDVNDPRRAGRRQGDTIAIFQGEAQEARDRRPRQVRDIAEIRRQRAERRANRDNQQPGNEAVAPDDATGSTDSNARTGTAQQRRQKGDRNGTPDQATGSTERANANQDQGQTNRQRRSGAPQQADEQSGDNAGNTQRQERPANRAERRRQQNNAGDNQQNIRQRRDNQQPAERVQRRRQNQNNAGQQTRQRRQGAEQGQQIRQRRQGAEQGQQIRRRARPEQSGAAQQRQQRGQEVRQNRARQQAPVQQRRRGNQGCDPRTQNCQ